MSITTPPQQEQKKRKFNKTHHFLGLGFQGRSNSCHISIRRFNFQFFLFLFTPNTYFLAILHRLCLICQMIVAVCWCRCWAPSWRCDFDFRRLPDWQGRDNHVRRRRLRASFRWRVPIHGPGRHRSRRQSRDPPRSRIQRPKSGRTISTDCLFPRHFNVI